MTHATDQRAEWAQGETPDEEDVRILQEDPQNPENEIEERAAGVGTDADDDAFDKADESDDEVYAKTEDEALDGEEGVETYTTPEASSFGSDGATETETEAADEEERQWAYRNEDADEESAESAEESAEEPVATFEPVHTLEASETPDSFEHEGGADQERAVDHESAVEHEDALESDEAAEGVEAVAATEDDRPEEAYVEEGNRWSGDGPVNTAGQFLTPDPSHPESADLVVRAQEDEPVEAAAAAGLPVVHEPLLAPDTEQGFLTRWNEIQVGFVEDPAQSVRNADALIEDIASAYVNAFGERRDSLTAAWNEGTPDTEELRLALKAYRTFIGVVLPKQ